MTSEDFSEDGRSVSWLREWHEPGTVRFRLGRQGEDLLAEWEDFGTLRASRDGSRHSVSLGPLVSEARAHKLRTGHVRALLAHLDGGVTLHGSAVALDGRAIAFVGPSGFGKSTLAADLCEQHGYRLLADDLVAIRVDESTCSIAQSESTHWLFSDSVEAIGRTPDGRGKVPIEARQPLSCVASAGVRLVALVALAFDDAARPPRLEPLEGIAAFEAVNAGFVRFVVDEPTIALRDLDHISKLSAAVPVLRLTRRRTFADMPAVAQAIRARLSRGVESVAATALHARAYSGGDGSR